MEKTTVSLTSKQLTKLRETSKKRELGISEIIRRAIDMFFSITENDPWLIGVKAETRKIKQEAQETDTDNPYPLGKVDYQQSELPHNDQQLWDNISKDDLDDLQYVMHINHMSKKDVMEEFNKSGEAIFIEWLIDWLNENYPQE